MVSSAFFWLAGMHADTVLYTFKKIQGILMAYEAQPSDLTLKKISNRAKVKETVPSLHVSSILIKIKST